MKTIILAGGRGTRLSEETQLIPKPMVKIGGKPILWHIMQIYAIQGHSEFTLALGYLGDVIRDYVRNLPYMYRDLTANLETEDLVYTKNKTTKNLKISTLETGLDTQTGGRISACIESFSDEHFMITYGDGVGNVNINNLIDFHRSSGKLVTVTAVRPPSRFGNLTIDINKTVSRFGEKTQTDAGWINGGFFVADRKILKYFNSKEEIFEQEVLGRITRDKQLAAYEHSGFWQPMDTIRERDYLNELALAEKQPWLSF
jgi:glucose-1-phosphate cytidylyltransferase